MTRTPDEIRASVYAACNGDWTDESSRIADLQRKLTAALIWVECEPAGEEKTLDGGWYAAGRRQMSALRDIQATYEPNTTPFASGGQEDPQHIIDSIAQHIAGESPWDINAVDEYIQQYGKDLS